MERLRLTWFERWMLGMGAGAAMVTAGWHVGEALSRTRLVSQGELAVRAAETTGSLARALYMECSPDGIEWTRTRLCGPFRGTVAQAFEEFIRDRPQCRYAAHMVLGAYEPSCASSQSP